MGFYIFLSKLFLYCGTIVYHACIYIYTDDTCTTDVLMSILVVASYR